MQNLTERQSEILSFIKDFIYLNRCSPTNMEIALRFGFTNNAARSHLEKLERKGAITLKKPEDFRIKMSRNIRVVTN